MCLLFSHKEKAENEAGKMSGEKREESERRVCARSMHRNDERRRRRTESYYKRTHKAMAGSPCVCERERRDGGERKGRKNFYKRRELTNGSPYTAIELLQQQCTHTLMHDHAAEHEDERE